MNEPWPGADWTPCLTGCPDLEQQLLAPFYARMTDAVRSVDRRHPLYVEPFVLFNFGARDDRAARPAYGERAVDARLRGRRRREPRGRCNAASQRRRVTACPC